MRMRKKKWAEPYLLAHEDFIYSNPSFNKGKWKELLNKDILHVEIGMGKGGYIEQMAKLYPDYAWVGIEKDTSAAAVAARKILENDESFDNVKMINGDGENLKEWFSDKEIDVIHLNFSDPWPKKYTHKRRLSSEKFLSIYRDLLNDDGCIIMKTDNANLFEDSLIYFLENGFTFKEVSVDYRRNSHDEDAITEYENKFISEGKAIYRLVAIVKK